MKQKKTIKLQAGTIELLNSTLQKIKLGQDELGEMEKQLQQAQQQMLNKREGVKAMSNHLEGIMLGVLALEGIDVAKHNIALKEDMTELYVYDKPEIPEGETDTEVKDVKAPKKEALIPVEKTNGQVKAESNQEIKATEEDDF